MKRSCHVLPALIVTAFLAACVPSAPPSTPAAGAQVVAGVTLPDRPSTGIRLDNPAIRFGGGDGSSLAQAVIVQNAAGEADGVQSEYAWLSSYRPGWKPTSQALLDHNGKPYDALTIAKGGKSQVVYFDISGYFGRF